MKDVTNMTQLAGRFAGQCKLPRKCSTSRIVRSVTVSISGDFFFPLFPTRVTLLTGLLTER